MKKRIIAVLLSIVMLISCVAFSASASTKAEDAKLKFNSDGKFKIIQYTDIHLTENDEQNTYPLKFIDYTMKQQNPDLVLLTGDVLSGYEIHSSETAEKLIRTLMEIFEKYGKPVSYVYGNHDDEFPKGVDMTKEDEFKIYSSYPCSITSDEVPEISGVCNYNIPILSSDGKKVAFNIWMMDSGTYSPKGGYDWVHTDQLEWYRAKSDELAAENGGKVPSLMFQHIVVPELFDYVDKVKGFNPRAIYWNGAKTVLPKGTKGVYEFMPCPPNTSDGQFETIKQQGDVLALVHGHDHANTYDLDCDGIRIISSPYCSFGAWGVSRTRGARVFVLDEKNPEKFETSLVLMKKNLSAYTFKERMKYYSYNFKQIQNFISRKFKNLKNIIK